MIKKIIYVSGTRADYGLMQEVLNILQNADDIYLSICVTGMHLDALYAKTIQEIERDGFNICASIPVDVTSATPLSMAQSIGYQLLGITEVLAKEKPDFLMLLGDRGEMLAAAISAVHLNIPIIHFHGGERSGTVDEMVRHAISKLAHYHLVATKASKERLIKMGEKDETIFIVGAPGLEALSKKDSISRDEFCMHYQLDSGRQIALLVYHPVVQEYHEIAIQFNNALEAALEAGLQVICLEPNSDAGGQLIRHALSQYKNHPDVRIIAHLPRSQFIDCLANVNLILGNSSSGIIEAATFNLIAVNIGTRQNLRECSDNVIHTDTSYDAILDAITVGLSRPPKTYINVYAGPAISHTCYHIIKSLNLDSMILNKANTY